MLAEKWMFEWSIRLSCSSRKMRLIGESCSFSLFTTLLFASNRQFTFGRDGGAWRRALEIIRKFHAGSPILKRPAGCRTCPLHSSFSHLSHAPCSVRSLFLSFRHPAICPSRFSRIREMNRPTKWRREVRRACRGVARYPRWRPGPFGGLFVDVIMRCDWPHCTVPDFFFYRPIFSCWWSYLAFHRCG